MKGAMYDMKRMISVCLMMTMKKYLCLLLSMLLLMTMTIPATAETTISYTELEDGTLELTAQRSGLASSIAQWISPTYIDGKLVSTIGTMNLYADNLVFSEGITVIKDDAFYCFSQYLQDIVFPSTLKYIGDRAFLGPDPQYLSMDEEPIPMALIPPSVTYMGDHCIGYMNLTLFGGQDFGIEPISGFTIYGTAGSVAEQYAIDNGFAFVDMATFEPCGDVTLDTLLDMEDAFELYQTVSSGDYPTSALLLEGDLDGNGKLDMIDAFSVFIKVSGEE